jgi:hypothetical protein
MSVKKFVIYAGNFKLYLGFEIFFNFNNFKKFILRKHKG